MSNKCNIDNYAVRFYIDNENNLLSIVMKTGEVYSVSYEELVAWLNLGNNSGGIKSGVLQNTDLIITNKDNTQVTIDLSDLQSFGGSDSYLISGTLLEDNILELSLNNGSKVNVDLSSLQVSNGEDIHLATGELLEDKILELTLNNGDQISVDLTEIIPEANPYIVSGSLDKRDNGYYLDFIRNDNSTVTVDMTDIINEIMDTVTQRLLDTGYRINTVNDDYTLTGDDFNGHTIIRANKDGDITINIPRPPSEDFIGKAVNIRKTNGDVGTFTYLDTSIPDTEDSSYVTLVPLDASPIRRIGSAVSLVYVGNGVWDIYGELP